MTNKLVPFLREVLERLSPFYNVVSHIQMKELDDGRILAMGQAVDGSMTFEAKSIEPIDFEGARACLGNLSYLNTLLKSNIVSNGCEFELAMGESRSGNSIVRSITFRPNDRIETMFIATDPFRESVAKLSRITINEWPVVFEMNEEAKVELDQIKRIHGTAPSAGKEDLLKLSYSSDTISVQFGSDAHVTLVDLPVIPESTTNGTISIILPSTLLMNTLKQATINSDSIIIAELAEKALRISTQSDMAEYTFILIKRRVRDE